MGLEILETSRSSERPANREERNAERLPTTKPELVVETDDSGG
jgi:hypothetical protein